MWFVAAIFLSAFLLFLVQSVAGKQLLPWFGGTPMTWAACMLFFQLLLLGGYLYAWAADRWLGPRTQRLVHLGLLLAGGVTLAVWDVVWAAPLLAPDAWKPAGTEAPVGLILKVLAGGVGIPFLALAGNAPLLQRWFSERWPERRVYRLYAVSNAGSMIGLLSFPFVFEPLMALPDMAKLWAVLFGVMAVFCLLCARRGRVVAAPVGGEGLLPAPAPAAPVPGAGVGSPGEPEGGVRGVVGRWGLWIGLAASASAMFLATTNHLSQEVALVPMLWVLPLAIYLGAFMIVFHDLRWYRRAWVVPATVVVTVVALWSAYLGVRLPIPHQIVAHSVFLFLFCLTLLGELARLKPDARHLTSFYLAIAIGGALGGVAVSLGAPLLLESTSEFHVMLLVGWVMIALAFLRDGAGPFRVGGAGYVVAFVALAAGGVLRVVQVGAADAVPAWVRSFWTLAGAGVLVAGGVVLALRVWWPRQLRSPVWACLLVAGVVLLAELFMLDRVRSVGAGLVARERNFFGSAMVQRTLDPNTRIETVKLIHGQINHGFQYASPVLKNQPAGYCSPTSGVGRAFLQHPRRAAPAGAPAIGGLAATAAAANPLPLRIGVAGLGVGAMAAYARAGDTVRFYEINPVVGDFAAGPDAYFTYIADTPGTVDVVLGDARLSMERELAESGSQRYDVLALDAFSSDSVPVHLLTVEAFEVYLAHLRDRQSILAVNISNRFLDFRPLIYTLADRFDLHAEVFFDIGNPPVPTASVWALLSQRPYRPDYFDGAEDWPTPAADKEVLWTDNHSDIFGLLRWSQAPVRRYVIMPPGAQPQPQTLPGPLAEPALTPENPAQTEPRTPGTSGAQK